MSHLELSRLLACLNDTPDDEVLWSALADCLEENGEPLRAELARLNRQLRGMKPGRKRSAAEARARELVNGGVLPCVPELTNSIGMRFALIPAGTFWMGTSKGRISGGRRHEVTLTKAFWMGSCPVNQAQYRTMTGVNPSYFSQEEEGQFDVEGIDTDAFPVESVTWEDAAGFCRVLSARHEEAAPGRTYRLPTEAEWEYCCCAGVSTEFHFGAVLDTSQANVMGAVGRPCPVGSYRPNAWGLFDMHGNVNEWCADWWGEYPTEPQTDPKGPGSGPGHIQRGGGYGSDAIRCRSADRLWASGWGSDLGFRVVLTRG